MIRKTPPCTALRLVVSNAGLLALAACGSSATWSPPPAPVLPVAPGPEPIGTMTPTMTPAPTGSAAPSMPAKSASPMPADLPNDVEGTLAAHASCKQKECVLATMLPSVAGLDTKGPAAVFSYELAADSAVTFPRD